MDGRWSMQGKRAVVTSAAALMAKAGALLAVPPSIEQVDVLAAKT